MSATTEHDHFERVLVWEWPVRLAHWLIVGSIGVLAVTGIYIGTPFLSGEGQATYFFTMGTIKSIHFITAMVFIIAVFGRLLWMFAGNPYARWHQFLPLTGKRLTGVWKTLAYYLFLRRESPAYVGHNPLAGATYLVVYALFLLMIATGLAMASAGAGVDSVLASFRFLIPLVGGLQMAHFLHHVTMWLLLGFAAHHVWSAFLVSSVERTSLMDSIFTGYKVLPPDIARRARQHIEDGQ